jgi:hypothetical protein
VSALETNIYPIVNLHDFSAKYRLYGIRGLQKEQPEYYQNRQILISRISYTLRTPATIVESGDDTYLVLREDAGIPCSPFPLVRLSVYLEPSEQIRDLNFSELTPEAAPIAIRFLQFMLQAPLSTNPHLWQPGAGRPFFEKTPTNTALGVTKYAGFVVRVVPITSGGLGLCVDLAHKYVRSQSLPVHLTRPEFRPFKGRHCIYHYGHRWYEIQLREFADVTVSEYQIGDNGARSSLLEFIARESQKPISAELAQLPTDASVVMYSSNQGELRAVPAALCYPVLDSADTA